MADRAVPNLPSRNFSATEQFYGTFGFQSTHHSDEWLILARCGVELEFFSYAALDPYASSFRCSVRIADLDEVVSAITAAGVPESMTGMPRLTSPVLQPWGARVAYLIDPDGSQLALIDDSAAGRAGT